MKRVYVNEEWCLGCHLCEYNCAFANSGMTDMATALKGKPIFPRINIKGNKKISNCKEKNGFISKKYSFSLVGLSFLPQLIAVDGVVPDAVKSSGYGTNGVHKSVGKPNDKYSIFLP